jgi:hypothetical protein
VPCARACSGKTAAAKATPANRGKNSKLSFMIIPFIHERTMDALAGTISGRDCGVVTYEIKGISKM